MSAPIKEITLPYRITVPVKIKETLVEGYEPFWKNRMFWLAASVIAMVVFVFPKLRERR